ncbi:MAG: LptF/LptG family permease [Verrucomicrobia bacterium]|nr:LptF/LptG family permease [Verrucomicrobiota bacterium]
MKLKRLDRHVLARFLTAFLAVMAGCVFLFSMFDFSLRAARFVQHGFTVWRVLEFYLYFTPELLVLFMPVVVTIAAAWSIGRLARDNEVTAMRAAGISPARIAAPLLIACGALAVTMFVLNERIVTRTHDYIEEESRLLYHRPIEEVLPSHYFYTDDKRGKLEFAQYHVQDHLMIEPTWRRPATADSPSLFIKASRAEWIGGYWWFFDVQVKRGDRLQRERDKRIMYDWDLPPEYITGEKDPRSMTIGELNRAIRRDAEFQPARALEYRLERHLKLLLPILVFLMLLVTFPVMVRLGTGRRPVTAGLGTSLLLCFVYYVLYIGLAAVTRKWIDFPPLVWVPNLAYGTAGLVMFLRMS